jgi:hypothetical protein
MTEEAVVEVAGPEADSEPAAGTTEVRTEEEEDLQRAPSLGNYEGRLVVLQEKLCSRSKTETG